jgi:DNA-binding MarR family transcriptional regulator
VTTQEPRVGDDELMDALTRTAFDVMGILTRVAAEHDLSLTQLRVLGILRDRHPRMADLAAHLGLDRSTMSGLVDRAERRGLLRRVPSADDRRAIEVEMTAEGRALGDRLIARLTAELEPRIVHLAPAARDSLTSGLQRLLDGS